MSENTTIQKAPLFVGDNLALDFINSTFGTGPAHQECLASDDAVLTWLKLAGVLSDDIGAAPEGLLALALELRENAKSLVNGAKQGECADASVVNHILNAGRASKALTWNSESKSFTMVMTRPDRDPVSLLEPIAQAIADLLSNTPLDLVRKCEACDCTLLFHDKTKAHRRRWCSMALCGNRMKVAAFRSRKMTTL